MDNLPQDQVFAEETDEFAPMEPTEKEMAKTLTIRLSSTLHQKILGKSQIEGIPVEDLVRELIAEGVVLRAWEIVERKNTMRAGSPAGGGFQPRSNNNNQRSGGGFRQGGQGQGGGRPKGPSNGPSNKRAANYNHILEDNANFIEYVRSQERKKR